MEVDSFKGIMVRSWSSGRMDMGNRQEKGVAKFRAASFTYLYAKQAWISAHISYVQNRGPLLIIAQHHNNFNNGINVRLVSWWFMASRFPMLYLWDDTPKTWGLCPLSIRPLQPPSHPPQTSHSRRLQDWQEGRTHEYDENSGFHYIWPSLYLVICKKKTSTAPQNKQQCWNMLQNWLFIMGILVLETLCWHTAHSWHRKYLLQQFY